MPKIKNFFWTKFEISTVRTNGRMETKPQVPTAVRGTNKWSFRCNVPWVFLSFLGNISMLGVTFWVSKGCWIFMCYSFSFFLYIDTSFGFEHDLYIWVLEYSFEKRQNLLQSSLAMPQRKHRPTCMDPLMHGFVVHPPTYAMTTMRKNIDIVMYNVTIWIQYQNLQVIN